jgi:uncharacterized damage-inducible protein DinB
MSRTLLDDAFAHHVWATRRLIDACLLLTPEQLDAAVPGAYGPILGTMRHLIDADCYFLSHLMADQGRRIDTGQMGLGELKTAMEANERAWTEVLSRDLEPDAVVRDVDDDGYARDAPIGLRLAQALHHGTDHRSQICTALTALRIEPPRIDVWAFGEQAGRLVEIEPTT